MRQHTILVTGATGKTGRRLIPLLVERGVTVRAAGRTPRTAAGVESVRFDWNDPATYAPARRGAHAVYVVTGDLATPGDPADHVRTLLDGAAEAGVERVVLLSALGVGQASPDDPLRRVELAAEESGVPATIVRPGAFMQNFSEPHWSRLDHGIRHRDEIVLPGGDALVNWVSTQDIAAVAAAALTEDGHDGKGYAVVGPRPLTMAQVAAHISTATGRAITYVESGRDQVRADLVAAGTPPHSADFVSDMYTHSLTSGAFGITSDDVATVTGRAPATFADFATDAAPAWRR